MTEATRITVIRDDEGVTLEVDRWVVTEKDSLLSFRLPLGAERPLIDFLGGDLAVGTASFSILSGDGTLRPILYAQCRVRDWFRNGSVVVRFTPSTDPWWHCPACGLEIQCAPDQMNDGKCGDCNDPFLEGRAPSELRTSLDLRDQAVALGKGKPHPLHPDDSGYHAECAFCWDERAVARRAEFSRLAAETAKGPDPELRRR